MYEKKDCDKGNGSTLHWSKRLHRRTKEKPAPAIFPMEEQTEQTEKLTHRLVRDWQGTKHKTTGERAGN
jgi:hypothetical protein